MTTVSGRFPVALPYQGEPGASFGGDSIDESLHISFGAPHSTDGDQPSHDHTLQGAMNLPSTSVGLASGCCAGGYAGAGTYDFQATTSDNPTELPFLMIALCQRAADK